MAARWQKVMRSLVRELPFCVDDDVLWLDEGELDGELLLDGGDAC
jgi:hypothetical protein